MSREIGIVLCIKWHNGQKMPISTYINGKYFLAIRKCQLRPQWVTTTYPTRMNKIIKIDNTNFAKDVEQPGLTYYWWEYKWYNHFRKRSGNFL